MSVSKSISLIENVLARFDKYFRKIVPPEIVSMSKNPQSFLEISPVQKEVLLSHYLQDHAHE